MVAHDSEDAARHRRDDACSRIARAAGAALLTVDRQGTILEWFGAGERLLGLITPTAPPSLWSERFDAERAERLRVALGDGQRHDVRLQLRSVDGGRWIEIIASRVSDDADRFACVVTDATEAVRDASSMRHIEHVLDGTSDFVVTWLLDSGEVTWSNDPATVILGLTPGLDRGIRDIVPSDQIETYELALTTVDASGNWAGTLDLEPVPEYRIPCKVNLIKGRDPETDQPSLSLVATEISDLRAAEDRLSWAAEHDQLTGLANRVLLERHLDATIRRVQTTDELAGLLYCDLDRFKPINDEHGHAAGDAVLIAVSERLTSALRDHDLACRFGGDEFVVLINRISVPSTLDRIAERIERIVAEPIAAAGQVLTVGVSVGAVVLDGGTLDAETALQRADQFMYAAKQARVDERLQRSIGQQ